MAFEKQFNMPQPVTEPACIHLRSKPICVTGDFDPKHFDESGAPYCWCNCNQHVIGPDNIEVNRERCISGRECFRSSH